MGSRSLLKFHSLPLLVGLLSTATLLTKHQDIQVRLNYDRRQHMEPVTQAGWSITQKIKQKGVSRAETYTRERAFWQRFLGADSNSIILLKSITIFVDKRVFIHLGLVTQADGFMTQFCVENKSILRRSMIQTAIVLRVASLGFWHRLVPN